MRSYLCLVIIAILANAIKADFTCLINEKEEKEACKLIDACFILYKKTTGVREYGCLINMTAEQKSYCAQNPTLCKDCDKKDCNTRDKMKLCLSCKTTDDDLRCTTDPEAVTSFEVCKEECNVWVDKDGRNTRGCSHCDDADLNCLDCEGEKCNDKRFPLDRRECFVKDGGTEVCINKDDVCLTILLSDGKPSILGCKQQWLNKGGLSQLCKQNPERCLECDENKCNEEKQYNICAKCDETNEDCLSSPEKISEKSKEYCLGKCFVKVVGATGAKRGCNDGKTCAPGDKTCKTCKGPFCNPPKRRSCYVDKNNMKACDDLEDKCVTIFDNSSGKPAKQGCHNELPKKMLEICRDPKMCNICENDNCNKWETKLTCYGCKGPTCVEPSDLCLAICETGTCFVKDLGRRGNERGCFTKGTKCPNGRCEKCFKNGCNKHKFPKNRVECVVKDGEVEYCENDQCYTSVLEDGTVKRGCLTDDGVEVPECTNGKCEKCTGDKCNTKYVCLQCDNNESCSKPNYCFDADTTCFSLIQDGERKKGCTKELNCTDYPYCEEYHGDLSNKEEPEITGAQCYQCNGEEDCAEEQDGQLTPCNDPEDLCYVVTDGTVTRRGCSSLLADVACNMPYCKKCGGVGCNSFPLEKPLCYQCKKEDEGCVPDLDEDLIELTECSHYQMPGQEVLCFTKVNGTRGCLSPMDEKECNTENKCSKCRKNGCNNESLEVAKTNESELMKSSLAVWLLSFGVLLMFTELSSL